MKNNQRKNHDGGEFQGLGLRPATQIFNQIRYWSALDEPNEEKWDYTSHLSRTERREKGLVSTSTSFNARPLIASMLVVLLLISLSTGVYLAWPYLSHSLTKEDSSVQPVTAYTVHLGSRNLGLIQDSAALDAFAEHWLAEQNAAADDITYTLHQALTYEEVLVDKPFLATLQEVEDAFVKHVVLDIA